MKRLAPRHRLATALLAGLAVTSPSSRAWAWDPQTTHVGLSQAAATTGATEATLRAAGFEDGWFEQLSIPAKDAEVLLAELARVTPSVGVSPSKSGSMFALAWLSAGAVLTGLNPDLVWHRFLPGAIATADFARPQAPLWAFRTRQKLQAAPPKATGALAYVRDPQNPFGLLAFHEQWRLTLTSPHAAERQRHLAAALVAAGSMMHFVAEMAVPDRVRPDSKAIAALYDGLLPIERVAARSFGRLGTPIATGLPANPQSIDEFFVGPTGLATWTTSRFLPAGALPSPRPARGLTLPAEDALRGVNVSSIAATAPDGATLQNAQGMCLGRYRQEGTRVEFYLDDACLLEQARRLVPMAGAYARSLLDYLFRNAVQASWDQGAVTVVLPAGARGKAWLLTKADNGDLQEVRVADLPATGSLRLEGLPAGHLRVVVAGTLPTGEPFTGFADGGG